MKYNSVGPLNTIFYNAKPLSGVSHNEVELLVAVESNEFQTKCILF